MFEIYYFWENCKSWFSSFILSFKILIGYSFYLFGDLAEQFLWGFQRVPSCSLPHPLPDHLSQGWITMIFSLLVFVFLKRSLLSHEFENSWVKLLCFFPCLPLFPGIISETHFIDSPSLLNDFQRVLHYSIFM